jgi:5-methyltetrahydrofolate--homocysteine methyltransferase
LLKGLDANKLAGERPTVATIVERIGPLRNKTADQSGAVEGSEGRRRRRG